MGADLTGVNALIFHHQRFDDEEQRPLSFFGRNSVVESNFHTILEPFDGVLLGIVGFTHQLLALRLYAVSVNEILLEFYVRCWDK